MLPFPRSTQSQPAGPFTPTLIIHGGAGAIPNPLPGELYAHYCDSMQHFLTSTHAKLTDSLAPLNALDAACYAVSLMEKNELFNCGFGSVFTRAGRIEMEASVAVASISEGTAGVNLEKIFFKKSAAVSMVCETEHPILLAREVLMMAKREDGDQGRKHAEVDARQTGLPQVFEMHGHLSGREAEEYGWSKRLLRMRQSRFWTAKRWMEHRKDLGLDDSLEAYEKALKKQEQKELDEGLFFSHESEMHEEDHDPVELTRSVEKLPSQGTVGCVCLDSWGNVAVATSTGGLTNKQSGRIGDTPTVGAGFWAESWDLPQRHKSSSSLSPANAEVGGGEEGGVSLVAQLKRLLCLRSSKMPASHSEHAQFVAQDAPPAYDTINRDNKPHRRAIAMSGTGNGDSFLRSCAARTTGSVCRMNNKSLESAIAEVAGSDGVLQKSAEDRWNKTGEGQGGIIGIEVSSTGYANVSFDFNCSGMWRAWYEGDDPKVAVFKDK